MTAAPAAAPAAAPVLVEAPPRARRPGLPLPAQVDRLLDGWMPPRDLLLGVASAGYQCEGGYNGEGQPQNNWWSFEGTGGREVTGACGRFWDRPEPDLDAAAGMSLNAFRLSIEAARLRPDASHERREAAPALDEAAVRRYAEILLAARKRGLEPVVTLHHFTEPAWWGSDPWLCERGPDLFVAHAAEACERVNGALEALGGAPVRRWITINEPNGLALTTYGLGAFPCGFRPGLGALDRLVAQLDGFFSAHVRAHAALHRVHREHGWPSPLVTINNYVFDCYGLDRMLVDLLCARSEDVPLERKPLEAWMRHRRHEFEMRMARVRREGSRPSALRSGAALLRPFLDKVAITVARLPRLLRALAETPHELPLDALTIDLYEPLLQNHLAPPWSVPGHAAWRWHVYPPALYDALEAYRDAAPSLPILVAETGMGVERPVGGSAQPRPDGWRRDDHVRAHFFQLLRAVRAGVRVEGLLVWSVADNYEWGSFTPRFGLQAVDFADPERPRSPLDAAGVDAVGTLRSLAQAVRAGQPEELRRALLAM